MEHGTLYERVQELECQVDKLAKDNALLEKEHRVKQDMYASLQANINTLKDDWQARKSAGRWKLLINVAAWVAMTCAVAYVTIK